MNLAAYARIENAAYRAGHKIVQDKPKPAIPADSDERRILSSMRPERWYTVNDVINRTGLARGIVTHRLNSMSRMGKVGSEQLPVGDMAYKLPDVLDVERAKRRIEDDLRQALIDDMRG